MNNNGFSGTKIIGYEHNWSDAANYPVQLVSLVVVFLDVTGLTTTSFQMQQAGDAFAGVSFHCYAGTVSDMTEFTSQYPDKVSYAYFKQCEPMLKNHCVV